MSYYKGCNIIKTPNIITVEQFLEGKHATWSKYNELILEPLANGFTKYNQELLNEYKSMQKDFRCLITIQSMLISLISEYVPNSKGKVNNIWRIIHSQKGTIAYYGVIMKAIKQYKIQHQNVYDAIKADIAKDKERISRNTAFIDSSTIECGLNDLIEAIKKEFNETLFENAKRFSYEFVLENNSIIFDSDEFFKKRDNAYIDYMRNIAKKHNIDLLELLTKAETTALERNAKIKNEIKKEKQDKKLAEKQEKAKRLNEEHHSQLFNCISNGNEPNYLSQEAYKKLITIMAAMNGKCYFITCLSGNSIMFCQSNGKLTQSMAKAAYFTNPNDKKIPKIIKSLKQYVKEPMYSIEYIEHESFLQKDNNNSTNVISVTSEKDLMQIEIDSFKQHMNENINSTHDYHERKLYELSRKCEINHVCNIYYICVYTHDKRAYGFKPPTEKRPNICATSLSDMSFFLDKNEAQSIVDKYNDQPTDSYYHGHKLFLCETKFDNPTYWTNLVIDEINEFKNRFVTSLESFDKDTYYGLIGTNKLTHNTLKTLYLEHNHLSILVRKSLHSVTDVCHAKHAQTITIVNDNSSQKPFFKSKLTQNLMISVSPDDDKILQRIADQNTSDQFIYAVINLNIDICSTAYLKNKAEYIEMKHQILERSIHGTLALQLATQAKLKIEAQLNKYNNHMYYVYIYNDDTFFVKSVSKNGYLSISSKAEDAKYFGTKDDAEEFKKSLPLTQNQEAFVGEYHTTDTLELYQRYHKLILQEAHTITKNLNKQPENRDPMYLPTKKGADNINMLKAANKDLHVILRKKVNSNAQMLQVPDRFGNMTISDALATAHMSFLPFKFQTSITDSIIYATTPDEIDEMKHYIQTLDNNYIYRVCKI